MKLPVGHVAGKGVVKASGFGGLGERLLRTMGWEKGQGLGKDKQGMKDALEVKKKEDTVGVRYAARLHHSCLAEARPFATPFSPRRPRSLPFARPPLSLSHSGARRAAHARCGSVL